MRGEKVSGGYEVGFVHTEQHRDIALAALTSRDWFKRRYSKYLMQVVNDPMGKVRAKAVKGTGFAGVKGWRIVVPTQGEMNAVADAVEYALLPLFKPGDRVRTLMDLHKWGGGVRPAGSTGTVDRIEAGEMHVTFDDQPGDWLCAPWWFEVAAK